MIIETICEVLKQEGKKHRVIKINRSPKLTKRLMHSISVLQNPYIIKYNIAWNKYINKRQSH